MISKYIKLESYDFVKKIILLQKKHIFYYFALLIVSIGIQIPVPFLVGNVIDGLSNGVDFQQVIPHIINIVLLSIVGVVLNVIIQKYSAFIRKKFIVKMQTYVYNCFQNSPKLFIKKFIITDVFSRLNSDIHTLNYLSPTGIGEIIRDLFFIFIFAGILIYLNSTILFFIIGLLPLAAYYFKLSSKRLSDLSTKAHESQATANSKLLESLNGINDFRTTGTLNFNEDRLTYSLQERAESFFQVSFYQATMFGILGAIPIIATSLIWAIGGQSVNSGEMSVGQLVSFLYVLSMMYGPINNLFGAASEYIYERAALKRINEIIYRPSAIDEDNSANKLELADVSNDQYSLAIKLKNVSFSYGERTPILSDVTFNAVIGDCIAITGANGSGKTMLLSILLGEIPPSSGEIYFNSSLYKMDEFGNTPNNIGYLTQNVFILGGTLRLNITLGRDIQDDQIIFAVKSLGLSSFLLDWEEGLDSIILENGENVSGGKKQKIGLIRAIVGKPSLLILDEPENNLDTVGINGLYIYLKSIKNHCTIILVSHGVSFNKLIDFTVQLSPSSRIKKI